MRFAKGMFVVAAALLMALPAQRAEAQVSFGPQLVIWDFEEVGLGARVDFGLSDTFGIEDGFFQGLFGTVYGNYIFQDPGTSILFNVNAAVPIQTDGGFSPYVGAGLNHYRFSVTFFGETVSSSSSGLNLLGGTFFDLGSIPAFAELQYSTTGAGFLSVSAGVLFGG